MLKLALEGTISHDVISNASSFIWASKCFVAIVFLIHWQFGAFQSLFNPQIWSNLSERREKTFGAKLQHYLVYVIFVLIALFILLMGIKLSMSYYFNGWLSLLIIKHGICDAFGSDFGLLSIFLIGHMSNSWLFVLFFYNRILSRVNQRILDFNADIKQVTSF